MDVETHDFVVHHLIQAQQAIELARRATTAKMAYQNFELAEQTIWRAKEAFGTTWQATRDPQTAVELMTRGMAALQLFDSGDAAPSVKIAISHMQMIVDRLGSRTVSP